MKESSLPMNIMPGAEPWSHDGGEAGMLCIHGFTGNPSSMRGIAEAAAAAGFSVELPRLPGHGTTVEDMMTTGWSDWSSAAEAAYQQLRARCSHVVVGGLSMGGALTLWLAAEHPEIDGIVCINPAAQAQPELAELAKGMIADGTTTLDGVGSDIADPDVTESAYVLTPLAPLVSLLDALADLQERYGATKVPMLLMNSPQDHVVDPLQAEFLAATWGGPLERILLDRSFHVATVDYDRELVEKSAIEFAQRMTS